MHIDLVKESSALVWVGDEASHGLSVAHVSFSPYVIYQERAFKIWCYPQMEPHSQNLIVLECADNEAKKDGVYVEVNDANDQRLMEGEMIGGELAAGIDSIAEFIGPYTIRYRILQP